MELSAQTDAGKARARACRELNACGIAALPFPGGSGVGKGWGQLGDGAPAAPQFCPAGLGGREGWCFRIEFSRLATCFQGFGYKLEPV